MDETADTTVFIYGRRGWLCARPRYALPVTSGCR